MNNPRIDHDKVSKEAFFRVLQGLCNLQRKPFSLELAQQQFAAPYCAADLLGAIRDFGFDADPGKATLAGLDDEVFPLLAWLASEAGSEAGLCCPSLIVQADACSVLLVEVNDDAPRTCATRTSVSSCQASVRK